MLHIPGTMNLVRDTSDHGTVRTMGWTVLHLGPKCLLGTSVLVPKCPDTSMPKCLGADLSRVRSVWLPTDPTASAAAS